MPTRIRPTETTIATQAGGRGQLADPSRPANVASDNDTLLTGEVPVGVVRCGCFGVGVARLCGTSSSIPIADATGASTPKISSSLAEKNEWFEFDKRPRLEIFPRLN